MPSQGIEQMHGFGFFSRLFMRSAFKIASKLLTLQGRQTFWNKFQPRKSNSFLVFDKSYLGLREIFGMMRTFNTGRNT